MGLNTKKLRLAGLFLIACLVLSLAQFSILASGAAAEGTGPQCPGVNCPEDTLPPNEPMTAPQEVDIFEVFGLLFGSIF